MLPTTQSRSLSRLVLLLLLLLLATKRKSRALISSINQTRVSFSKVASYRRRKTVVLRFMVEDLLSCEADARAIVRYQLSLQNNSRFSPLILAHKGSARLLPWLVDDRATLHHPRRIWCLLTPQSVQPHACACCGTLYQAFRDNR